MIGTTPLLNRGTAAAAVLLIVGCQPLPHPFADDVPRRGSPMLVLRDSASVTIAPFDGMPRATAEKLGTAMASFGMELQEKRLEILRVILMVFIQ